MSRNTWFFFTLIISPIIHLSQVASQCGGFAIKRDDKLVLYRITLNTYWTRIRFPKHYPDQRVPQFGKLIGRTHDRTYSLYRLGTRLNAGITQYIETGETRGLASEGNSPSVLDSFTGSAITRGEGTSTTRAFLDSNHTVVSAVARIIPSPDWFVGVDSFQLCIDGDWIDSVTVELDPLDAGTNEGLTFTSLMQRTWPQSLAYRITSRYPGHPAASFNYPNLPRLPPIATLTFTKLKEYTLAKVYLEEDVEMEFVSIDGDSSRYFPVNEPKASKGYRSPSSGADAADQRYGYWTNSTQNAIGNNDENAKTAIIDGIVASYNFLHDKRIKENGLEGQSRGANGTPRESRRPQGGFVGSVDRNSSKLGWPSGLFYSNRRDNHRLQIKNRRFHTERKMKKQRSPRDCKISDWSAWSACSRSCGVGETQRLRKIIVKARRGGKPCHSLKETKWCGSAAPCTDSHKQIDHFYAN
ncbi:uncharacterized protein [Fopius arisanus]|uniref:Spondin domain-containing protein n=2 Tax=Fopius arisanus TaxID=64838 RepID=A0A9R1SW86_9HYME|nr:PREDICTED: uncharacterized protein LOC105263615 [Fopius arisanus]